MSKFNPGDKVALSQKAISYYENNDEIETWEWRYIFRKGGMTVFSVKDNPTLLDGAIYSITELNKTFYEFELEAWGK